MRKTLSAGLLFASLGPLAGSLVGGCQPKTAAVYPPPNPSATWTAPPPMTAPTAMPTAAPTSTLPATTQGPSATPVDPATLLPATAALTADAVLEAPRMGAEGAPLAGSFQEGQVLEQPIMIMPGKCYTFIAASTGGPGPTELEIQLVAQSIIPGLVPMMGEQKGAAGKVVLGKGTGCIKLALIPIAVPSKWVIKALKGSGTVVGQAFSK
ncbi:MAG TPA: hypothetical protein VGL81_27405 [Polyangiaceae bacterium]|jgi:hypothetical protein